MKKLPESPPNETRPAAPPQPTGLPLAEDEQEVTFNSAGDTLFGTLLLPKQSTTGKVPATLLIAGSGPTDRNGNNPLIPGLVNSQLNFARVLADQGVASLRYDKIGTGKTGLGRFATNPAAVDFQTFVDEARSAYNFLKTRPEIDPQRIMVLGHSEGGLIGLVLADQLKDSAGVKALTLAAPLSRPYLQTIHDQLTTQYAAAVKAGSVTQEQADAALAELDQIIKSLQETGKIPATVTNPALKQIFSPYNEKFLAQVSKYDPQQIAAGLPTGFPALVMCGAKDQQVSCKDVKVMMQGFEKAGNSHASFFELPNVNHVFKEVSGTPNPGLDYGNPNLKFSQEAIMRLSAFVKANL
jgi:acetyl esterase/lipase